MTDDLFETPELFPRELEAVFNRYAEDLEHGDPYVVLKEILAEVETLGYTFDYDLSGTAYDLREIRG